MAQQAQDRASALKKTLDTLTIARSVFDFEDNGLDALCQRFGIRGKDKVTDEDWRASVKTGDEDTLRKVDKYCKGDVRNGKKLLEILMPYGFKPSDYGARRIIRKERLKVNV